MVVALSQLFLNIYSIITMIFISRSETILYVNNRNKLIYFLKAYGLSPVVFVATWIIYTLIMGFIKFNVYMFSIYLFIKFNSEYFSQFYGGLISVEQYWLLNILAFLATYSYCLFASIFLAHNQIGLKLISPILMMSIFVIFSLQFSESGLIRFEMISPHARLILLAFSSTSSEIYSLVFTINQYIIVFLYQFFIPLSSAIIFELIKIYRFELLKKLNEYRYKQPTGEQISIEL